MKAIGIIALFFALGCQSQTTRTTSGGTKPFRAGANRAYVLVITGQSNAGSRTQNLASDLTITNTDKVSHWDTTLKAFVNYSASNYLQNGFETQTAGLQSAKMNGEKIFVIRISAGTQPIANFASPGGSMWKPLDSAIVQGCRALRASGLEPYFLSTIWLQGEADVQAGTAQATYQTALSNLIDNYRGLDTRLASSQFVIVKIMETGSDASYTPGWVAVINAAYVSVAAAKTNVTLIRPEDYSTTLLDGVHYTNASYILIGNAWNRVIP